MPSANISCGWWRSIDTDCPSTAASTTQTIVGALVGVGFASRATVTWSWTHGSVSQIAASWAISPLISGGFAAVLFGTIKYLVLNRKDPITWGIRLIPFYMAMTASILALFIVVEAPTASSLEAFGVDKAVGIILGIFAGTLIIAYGFFQPYFYRRLVLNDCRLEWYHIPLGPTLWRDDPWIYFPSKKQVAVIDYYGNAYVDDDGLTEQEMNTFEPRSPRMQLHSFDDYEQRTSFSKKFVHKPRRVSTPYDRFLRPVEHLQWYEPKWLWSLFKFCLLRGITTDCVTHNLPELERIHARAVRYRNRVEHLWTYAQVVSAMLMSIAHGSNDVANAVGPWAASYSAWTTSRVLTEVDTPIWMLAVAGLLFGCGFWFFGYHIIRSLGNRITQHSPTRGFSMELGAAITVLVASRLGIPVSTTQCLTGAVLGVSLMNFDLKATNWKQVVHICFGWILTLPVAGLIGGLLMLMALNTPKF